MKSILIIFSFVLYFSGLRAHAIVWNNGNGPLIIGRDVATLEDAAGAYTFEELSGGLLADRFRASTSDILNFGYTESFYWLRFSLTNNSGDSLLLEVAHANLPTATLYYKDDHGTVHKVASGYRIHLDQKVVKSHYQVFPLPPGTHQLYVRLLSNSHPLPLNVWEYHTYEKKNYRQRMLYGFYYGFMFFVIISNIFFFFSLRNKLYLLYAFVVFVYTCYATVVMDGFALYFVPTLDLMYWYVYIPTIGVIVQTIYCLVFLEAKRFTPKLYKRVQYVAGYFILYFFAKNLLPLTVVLAFNTLHALVSFFIMGLVGLKVSHKGNRMGLHFALAYGIYFLLVVTEAIYIQTGTPTYVLGLSHVAWATLVEAFLLSFLLSKRFEWEKAEIEKARSDTQEKLLLQTRENERMVLQKNEILEHEVARRTVGINEANLKLKEAIATKDKFFSIIAHDLKGPFNSMLGFSNLLIETFGSSNVDQQKHFIEIINSELNRTHRLLDNLLIWSRAQRGSMEYKPEPLVLSQLSNDILGLLSGHASGKGIRLVNAVPNEVRVVADKNMLNTILRNLASNAIKFTEPGGNVCIALHANNKSAKHVTVAVSDSGVGIPKDIRTKLFSITETVSTRGTNKETGTGLGLVLCKEFVEKHNCKIWVESEVQKGSTFYFTMPAANTI